MKNFVYRDILSRVHKVRKNQEKTVFLRTVRKSQEILLKLEESQEKVWNFYHPCG